MFYFILIILVLVLFFMTRKDKKASDKYLSGALVVLPWQLLHWYRISPGMRITTMS